MASDYDLPAWFFDPDVTDEQRSRWLTQERCRRQAMRQQTPTKRRLEKQRDRLERRAEANPASVDVSEYR